MSRAYLLALSLGLVAGCGGDENTPPDFSISHDLGVADLRAHDLASADRAVPDLEPADLSLYDLSRADLTLPDGVFGGDFPCTVCDGRCVDVGRDPTNCGACDHVCGCGTSACTNGVCDAVPLVGSQGGPYALALSGGTLYWSTDSDQALRSVSTGGGTVTPIASPVSSVRGLALDSSNIYFTQTGANQVSSVAKGGGAPINFSGQSETFPLGIVTDGTTVFWTDYGPGTIRARPIASGAAAIIANGQAGATGIAVDANNVYWTNNLASGAVMQMPKAGGVAPTALASTQAAPRAIAVDANNVYWANQGDGTINSVPIGGGSVTQIATGQNFPSGLAVDSAFVYWTNTNDGTVMKAPIGGGSVPRLLAHKQDRPQSIVVDSSCIYFTDWAGGTAGAGAVVKAEK